MPAVTVASSRVVVILPVLSTKPDIESTGPCAAGANGTEILKLRKICPLPLIGQGFPPPRGGHVVVIIFGDLPHHSCRGGGGGVLGSVRRRPGRLDPKRQPPSRAAVQ